MIVGFIYSSRCMFCFRFFSNYSSNDVHGYDSYENDIDNDRG